ncbi:hypothetical protein GA0074692_3919 [Micromonospora pallida]|uniref:Uncharacterized protein n=1 Tax=Micromonospora pallida TaxID=145854 RepID=A0A1C6SZR9_9ACTN|nr:zinc ribbon domain-containing protein [Micromonospora pallida]SCL34763.1 hypothetical protein GA0074692_3919 [Micromonospora pallida]
MSTSLAFDLRLDHDRYLSPAARELHGILTVTARTLADAPVVAVGRPPQARIRIRTVAPTRVLSCRQVHPTVRELTGVPVDDRTVDHPTWSWGEERREYHLCLAVDGTDRPRGEDLLAARIDLLVDGVARTPPVAALVHWTDDRPHPGRVDPVTHDPGPQEPSRPTAAQHHDNGDEHHDSGDPPIVTEPLGRAVRLAAVADDTRRLAELGLLVASVDPVAATDGAVRTCRCGREAPPGARFCERCGAGFDGAGTVPT